MVFPRPGTPLSDQFGMLVVDAATLKVVFTDGSPGTWTANGPCRYADDADQTDIVVSQAGVIVVRSRDDGSDFGLAIGFPSQSHTLAELAGTWNVLGLERNAAGTYTALAATGTFDAAGAISAVTACADDLTWSLSGTTCATSATESTRRRANADGGFDTVEADGTASGREFAYRAGGGAFMTVKVDDDGSFQLRTPKHLNTPPTVGATTVNWDLTVDARLGMPFAISQSALTISSVDTTAGSWLRSSKTVGGSNDHPETLFANNPRDGYNLRAAGSALAADGSTVNFAEFTVLGLRGMGINPLVIPARKQLIVSVMQP